MAAKKKNNRKINKWDDDFYTQLAKKENYPARSVYKLKEIHNKCKVFKKGQKVLDLGCSPGSWLKYASEMVGSSGQVVGIDLKPVVLDNLENAEIFTGDIYEKESLDRLMSLGPYDIVMSDMAPNTTGNKFSDSVKSVALAEVAFYIAEQQLKPGGFFITKIFQGPDFDGFAKTVLSSYQKRRIFKPDSCRKNSKEIYIIGELKK